MHDLSLSGRTGNVEDAPQLEEAGSLRESRGPGEERNTELLWAQVKELQNTAALVKELQSTVALLVQKMASRPTTMAATPQGTPSQQPEVERLEPQHPDDGPEQMANPRRRRRTATVPREHLGGGD